MPSQLPPNQDWLEQSLDAALAALEIDPRWDVLMPVRPSLLVEAFAVGILSADAWFRPYRLPPEFAGVVDWIAFMVQRTFTDPLVALSPAQAEQLLADWAQDHPQWTQWDPEGQSASRTKRLATVAAAACAGDTLHHRPYLDLRAVTRNAAIYVMEESPRRTALYLQLVERR